MNGDQPIEGERKIVQVLPDGRVVLTTDTIGVSLTVPQSVETHDMTHLSDADWQKAHKSLLTHDIVVDNETKTLKYVKRKQVNK